MFKALTADASPEATEHWWHQRLTGGANLILLLWFAASIAFLGTQAALDMPTLKGWIAQPCIVVLMLLLIGSTAYHFRLGLQVFIEDYLKGAGRAAAIVALNFFTAGVVVWAGFSILKLALGVAA